MDILQQLSKRAPCVPCVPFVHRDHSQEGPVEMYRFYLAHRPKLLGQMIKQRSLEARRG